MRVAIDIDGVLAKFTDSFHNVINEVYPGRLPDGYQPGNWDYIPDILPTEMTNIWKHLDKTRGEFWYRLEPYWENKFAIQDYITHHPDDDFYYVTARKNQNIGLSAMTQTNGWLKRHTLLEENTSVVMKTSGRTKGDIYDALRISVSLDDYPKNIEESICWNHRPYLLDRPWNRYRTDLNQYRVKTVKEFLVKIGGE